MAYGGFFCFARVLGFIVYAFFCGTGVGVWGLNKTVGWAWDITNFVWWVGIGHAGTLISAILLLFRQSWRMSINRAAEAMTIFAVICAATFPLDAHGPLVAWLLLDASISKYVWFTVGEFQLAFACGTYLRSQHILPYRLCSGTWVLFLILPSSVTAL